jgi:putative PEP-CTERM system histidine kinase
MILSLLVLMIPVLGSLLALALAAFVLSRNCRAATNRWLATALLVIGAHQALLGAATFVGPGPWRLALFRLALATLAMVPPTWLAFSLRFGESNGGSRFRRWKPALLVLTAAAPVAWVALATARLVQPVRLGAAGPILLGLDGWGKAYLCVYLIGLSLVLLQLENTYRYADRLTRWKIKFLVVGVFVAFACQIVSVSYALLYGILHPLHPFFGSLAFLLGQVMIAFSLVRHRLLDVDVFVSRYVIYQSLTLAIIGGYLLSLGLVAEIFRRLGFALDVLSGTILGLIGAAALSLLLLSEEVRRTAKSFIHAHFYKHKYDYRDEWMEYTRRLSKAIAVPEIAAQTVNRILEVMWVRQAAMYTVADHPGRMSLVYQVKYPLLPRTLELSEPVLGALREHAKAIPSTAGVDPSDGVTTALVREKMDGIPVGGLVPVAALDAVVGLLVVGPELSGKPFGVDDRDLLAAVAAQAGALILNARLAQEASDGRELQALARLSAFVTHDLKNTVSMLSMLVENAKRHIAKPEFQADAIRTLEDVTVKMRNLLATLASPARCAGAQARSISLAPSVGEWIREVGRQMPPRIRIETRLAATPEVRVDPAEVRSVLHNLVLNGVEAIPGEGTILVETFQENGSALLAVTDTGQGMSLDFIQRRLFRPFQTTKPRGLGIGLYQCRHIIQSYGGTLSVESQEGKGTRMLVSLPAVPKVDSEGPRNEISNVEQSNVECRRRSELHGSR